MGRARSTPTWDFLTILLQDAGGGLEVRSGDTWISAPPIENTFVVNIGDMLELWTHGIYRATPHRVRNLANRRSPFNSAFLRSSLELSFRPYRQKDFAFEIFGGSRAEKLHCALGWSRAQGASRKMTTVISFGAKSKAFFRSLAFSAFVLLRPRNFELPKSSPPSAENKDRVEIRAQSNHIGTTF